MRQFLAGVIVGLSLTYAIACGGGGGSNEQPSTNPTRTDLLFGYYFTVTPSEVADHVNLVWVGNDPIGEAMRARVAGVTKIVLPVCWRCGQDNLRYVFDGMRAANVLSMVIALYPEDEPDLTMTEAEVVDMVRMVRSVAAEYPELAQVQVWAIYSPSGRAPGLEQFDAVGRDNYGKGPQAIGAPNQRLILVPGGASPWRESPDAYLSEANRNPRVIAIVPFLWTWPRPEQGLGIRDNGMAETYRAAGKQVTGR